MTDTEGEGALTLTSATAAGVFPRWVEAQNLLRHYIDVSFCDICDVSNCCGHHHSGVPVRCPFRSTLLLSEVHLVAVLASRLPNRWPLDGDRNMSSCNTGDGDKRRCVPIDVQFVFVYRPTLPTTLDTPRLAR